MHSFIKTKLIIAITCTFLFAIPSIAQNVYIALDNETTNIDVSASTEDNPAQFSKLSNYINTYSSDTDKDIYIYFKSGEYIIPAEGYTIASVDGLNVTFLPIENANVSFTGTSSLFINLPARSDDGISFNIRDVTIKNFSSTNSGTTNSSLFVGLRNSNINLTNVVIENISSGHNPLVSLGLNTSFYAEDCIFRNITKTGTSSGAIQSLYNTSYTFKNCLFEAWTSNNHLMNYSTSNCFINLENNTFKNIQNVSTNIIYINNSSTTFVFEGNSLYNNASTNIININNGKASIFNNTISGNTVTDAIKAATNNIWIVNNTIYNSGNVNLANNITFMNNILAGGSTFLGTVTNASHNITSFNANIYYCISGNTHDSDITFDFNAQFEQTLSGLNDGYGRQVHRLKNNGNMHVILERGGTKPQFSGSNINMTYDQLEVNRPQLISLGSIDVKRYVFSPTKTIVSTYNSEGNPDIPESVDIDLSQFILDYPEGVNKENTTFSFTDLEDGTIGRIELKDAAGSPGIKFIPQKTHGSTQFSVTVSTTDRGNFNHSETFFVKVTVRDMAIFQSITEKPPGYTDLENTESCFDFMGAVEFSSSYHFIAGYDGRESPPDGWNGGQLNDGERISPLTIPLVGDLNHDGYPEIIAFGRNNGSNNVYGYYSSIIIYNGRTGKKISKLLLPDVNESNESTVYHHRSKGYHGSPAPGSLVDSDRDGIVELIMCFPDQGGNTNYQRKVVSFNIVPTGIGDATTYELKEKWISEQVYNTNSDYNRPFPQVCDLDGDGIPEVLVYNRVYNAAVNPGVNASVINPFLFEIEPFDDAYMGLNKMAYLPGGGGLGDRALPFSYIYDMDGDGIYDIVAGGKIYKITKTNGLFNIEIIKCNPDPGDGFTGVADIDGDGSPDVVVVQQSTTDTRGGDIKITVWNPGFDGNGNTNPTVIAESTIGVTGRSHGSNSYVYIGDIDGYRDKSDNKLRPEIAVLTGSINLSRLSQHPNIKGMQTGDPGIGSNAGGIPTSGSNSGDGVLFALTYDPSGSLITDKLKLSFVLEHDDDSNNTGFTLFDFDNDGVQEICYRDRKTLRIIKPIIPYIKSTYVLSGGTNNSRRQDEQPEVIKFSKSAYSETGFEYPVIADINNDASAEIVVIASNRSRYTAHGYVYAVGNGTGDKFAPALSVWNQTLYDPFKINADSLTTPIGPAINRLNPQFSYTLSIKGEDGEVIKKVEDINPFNGTLSQATKYMELPNDENMNSRLYEPIVYLTESYLVDNNNVEIDKRPRILASSTDGNITIELTIGNREKAKTDVSSQTPIAIYRNGAVSKENFIGKWPLSEWKNVITGNPVGSNVTIQAGQELRISINLIGSSGSPSVPYSPDEVYIIRLGDNSDLTESKEIWRWGMNNNREGVPDPTKGTGIASRSFRDCNWGDQIVKAARYNAFDDAVTIQAFKDVEIDILANDILPNSMLDHLVLTKDSITMFPSAGILNYTSSNKIIYSNNSVDGLSHSVDSFKYQFTFWDEVRQKYHTTEASVYIYIVQSVSGSFVTCNGTSHKIELKKIPESCNFYWYNPEDEVLLDPNPQSSWTVTISSDISFLIEPKIATGPYSNIAFPKGIIEIRLIDPTATHIKMKWLGLYDTDWYNPGNWVDISDGIERPASYIPVNCIDVILSSDAAYYPILTEPTACNDIEMKNRSMIAGIDFLEYENAKVEISLKTTERDRFIMWSAPLKDTYSGDYHFKDNNNDYYWGDVYMNLFQATNPDNNSIAAADRFTATFGRVDKELPLGQAFNLKITSTTDNKDKSFTFPQTYSTYKDSQGQNYNITRTVNSTKFITHGAVKHPSGEGIELPIYGKHNESRLLQVVNPYMAYLDIEAFLLANNDIIESSYKIWNGQLNEDVFTIRITEDSDQRLIISDTDIRNKSDALTQIAPLQSFFVMRKDGVSDISTLKISSAWTTTIQENMNSSGEYELKKKDIEDENILRIKATQKTNISSTTFCFEPSATSAYNGNEDSRKVIYDETPLSIYSFTPSKEPLAINAGSDFSHSIGLGLRIKEAGEITLDFERFSGFHHDTYLIDNEKNQEINIQKTPRYTFTVSNAGQRETILLNDRFSLRFQYNPTSNEEITDNKLQVSTDEGYIHVKSLAGNIHSLQIYTVNGMLLFNSNKKTDYFKVKASRQKTYFLKVMVGEDVIMEKVYVK